MLDIALKSNAIKYTKRRLTIFFTFIVCFFVLFCGNASAKEYCLQPGDSVAFSNFMGTDSYYVDVRGACDCATYEYNGDGGIIGRTLNPYSIYMSPAHRAVVTNTSSSPYYLVSSSEQFNPVSYDKPALKDYILEAGKSFSYTNSTESSFYIAVPGAYSTATYQSNGKNISFGNSTSGSYYNYLFDGNREVITNDSDYSYTVYGGYDVFNPSANSTTALRKIEVPPNQSITFSNRSTGSFNVKTHGAYGFANYQSNGICQGAGRDSKGSYVYIPQAARSVITNEGSYSYQVWGANEVFDPVISNYPALTKVMVQPKKSITFTNKSFGSFYVNSSSPFNYAIYQSNGQCYDMGKETSSGYDKYIGAGLRYVITNSGNTSSILYGAYEVFKPYTSSNPALKELWVQPKKTITFTNKSVGRFYAQIPGLHTIVSYYSNGDNYACQRNISGKLEYIDTGLRAVVTNDSSSAYLVYGAYEVFKPSYSAKPAITSIKVDPDDEVIFLNISPGDYNVYFSGKCKYNKYNFDGTLYSSGESSGYYLNIPSAKMVEFMNTGTTSYELFGAYETFFIAAELSGLNGQNISKIDYSQIDPSSLEADPVDCATGAHIIEKSLLTVTGAQPIQFRVQYNSLLLNEGVLGKGWSHNFEARLENIEDGDITVHWNANRVNSFVYTGTDEYVSDSVYVEISHYVSGDYATRFDTLLKNIDGSYTLTKKDKTVYHFDASGRLVKQENGHGQALTFSYDNNGRLERVIEPISERYISIHYNSNGLIDYISDPLQRKINFNYNTDGCNLLEKIVDAKGQATNYTYYPNGQIKSATDNEGVRNFYNTYDEKGRVQTQEDARTDNEINRFFYDETSQPGKVITTVYNREGYTRVLTHDSNYRLLSIKDELDKVIALNEYDSDGNLKSSTNTLGQTITYSYDERGNLVTTADFLGRTTQMAYYPDDNLESITNTVCGKVYYFYNENNNVTTVIDPMNNETKFEYYPDTGFLWKEIKPRGGTKEYKYVAGQVYSVTDAVYNTVIYGYDEAGRLVTITDAANNTTTMHYDDADNLDWIKDPLNHIKYFTYDSHGNKLTEKDAKGNTNNSTYTPNGKLETVKNADGKITRYRYDGEDRLEYLTDARENTIQYSYDAKGRPIQVKDPLGNVITTEYDDLDRVTGKTDALHNKILTIEYDDANGLETITDAVYRTTVKHYDDAMRVDWIKDSMNRTTYLEYDALNRVRKVTDPLLGISSQDFNSDGNLNSITDPNNYQQEFEYDLAGRLRNENFAGDSTKIYNYDNRNLLNDVTNARGQTANYEYYTNGKVKSLSDPTGKIAYKYDDNGNLEQVIDESTGEVIARHFDNLNRVDSYTDARGNTIKYHYDEVGNLDVLTYPDGRQVRYGYDENNCLKTVTDWAYRVTEYRYYPNGLLWKTIRTNGTEVTYEYDAAGQLMKQTDIDTSGNIISQYDFTYYPDGTVNTEQSAIEEIAGDNPETVMTYSYDNRLATYNGQEVEYDSDGNMTLGPLGGEIREFQFDSRNRLTNVGDIKYQYDAENNRIGVARSVYGEVYQTIYVVNPQASLSQVLIKTDSDGRQTYYIYGLGLIGEEDEKGFYKTYHFDRRGSTVALTDDSGAVSDRFQYDPYGQLVYHSGTSNILFLYNGKHGVVTDSNGLLFMRTRYYNTDIKRFVNRDVIQGNVDQGQSLNRYAYVNGNPVSYIDPFGLSRDSDGIYRTSDGNVNWNLYEAFYAAGFNDLIPESILAEIKGDMKDNYGEFIQDTIVSAGGMIVYRAGKAVIVSAIDEVVVAGSSGADNIANGVRLSDQLTYEEASSIFTESGALKQEVINNANAIIQGSELKNPNIIKALTSDGSSIDDWAKMTTETFKSPSGDFQVHFYQNLETGEVVTIEMKVKFN